LVTALPPFQKGDCRVLVGEIAKGRAGGMFADEVAQSKIAPLCTCICLRLLVMSVCHGVNACDAHMCQMGVYVSTIPVIPEPQCNAIAMSYFAHLTSATCKLVAEPAFFG
jgi:hypothetical protein